MLSSILIVNPPPSGGGLWVKVWGQPLPPGACSKESVVGQLKLSGAKY